MSQIISVFTQTPQKRMVSFGKIPDLVGYLVLTEYGAVLESDGDLKNDENCANIVTSIINLADRYAQKIQTSFLFSYFWFCFVIFMIIKMINHN